MAKTKTFDPSSYMFERLKFERSNLSTHPKKSITNLFEILNLSDSLRVV